jgi:hypothetical protein
VADLAYTNPRPVPAPKKTRSISRPKSIATRSWARSSSVKSRLRISAPTDFRRLDTPLEPAAPSPRRRGRGFRPLELSIYLPSGRLSPLPDFTSDDWENAVSGLARPKPAVVREPGVPVDDDDEDGGDGFQFPRKPVSTSSADLLGRQSTASNDSGFSPVLQPELYSSALPGIPPRSPDRPRQGEYIITLPHKTGLVRPATSHSYYRHRSGSPDHEPGRSRSATDFVRPHSRTNSLRRSRASAANDVDEAIRELNTIVEERRVTALRKSRENLRSMGSLSGLYSRSSAGGGGESPLGSPTMHIPAVAPLMAGRARSQTLSDIGSAFSMPLTAGGGAAAPGPDPDAGDGPASPAALRPRAASRLRRWFSRANPGDESPVVPPQAHPFYQCASGAADDDDDGSSDGSSTLSPSPRSSSAAGSRSPASDDYPATTATTPPSLSPTREASLESRSAAVAAKAAAAHHQQPAPRPPTASSSSSGRRPSALVHPLAQHPQQPARRPKRGLSIDTTLSGASSAAASALGPASVPDAAAPVPPLHSGPVGVAY